MTERELAVGGAVDAPDDTNVTNAPSTDAADAPPDLRAALRHATADLHRLLDGAPDQRALLAPDLTLEHYATIMAKHHHALAVSEAALRSLEPSRPSDVPPYRPRIPSLEADLATLSAAGRSPIEPGVVDEPAAEPAPVTEASLARGRYLGTRYVLEGSTQGAASIARRLERHLPALSASAAFGYWRVQAEEAPSWQALTLTLARFPAHGQLATAAIAAARDTFGTFLRAFGLDAPDPSLAHVPEAAPTGAPG